MIQCSLLKFCFFWNFQNKKCVEFSLTSFGTLKYDCVINAIEVFNFLPLINNLVTIEFRFLLLIGSAIISSKTINILRFIPILYVLYLASHLSVP